MRSPLLAPVLLLSLAAWGCSRGEGAPSDGGIRDSDGRTVALDPEPRRILSLVPSMTELVQALGREDRLVGRTRFDTDPALAHLPSVGGATDPSLETVASLEPDLVIFWADETHPAMRGRIRALGARVYTARVMTLGHYREHARRLGRLLRAESGADSLLRALDRGMADIQAGVPDDAPPPSVLYLTWHDPPSLAGPDTFVDELIRLAGGRNAFGDAPVRWPTVSMEEVLARDPDWIVVPDIERAAAFEELTRNPSPWSSLNAVRKGHVLALPEDLVGRPGPGNVEAARLLAEALHSPAVH